MTKKTRRRYSDEFKADAVSLVSDQGYPVSEAARRLGVDRSLLDRWCRKQRQPPHRQRAATSWLRGWPLPGPESDAGSRRRSKAAAPLASYDRQ